MIGFIIRRTLWAGMTILVALVLVFLAVRLLPGNPILARFGQHPMPDQVEAAMEEAGWNQPLWRQLADYLTGVVTRADLGQSLLHPTENVRTELARRFPATVELAVAAMLLAIPVGILAGIVAAAFRAKWPDFVTMAAALLGVSIPVFFLGLMLISLSEELFGEFFPLGRRLPIGVYIEPITGLALVDTTLRGDWGTFFAAARHLFLPALTLSTIPASVIARISRSSMLEVLDADYVRTARAKGASRLRVIARHAFPNAAIPIANIAGLQASMLLTGAVLTETVFDWPGVGTYLVEAVRQSDYTVVQGAMLLVAAIFAVSNLLLDLFYGWLDPRVRFN